MKHPDHLIDHSPAWLKTAYVTALRGLRTTAHYAGLLKRLDQKAKHSRRFHFIRSLLAIHHLDDMISLDVPWWTYGAIDYLQNYIKNCAHPIKAFEYGSGASTLWLAKRCAWVVSIEHDEVWFHKLLPKITIYPNVDLQLIQPEPSTNIYPTPYHSSKARFLSFQKYVQSLESTTQKYDLIVIDGRCRVDCFQIAQQYLSPNGIILLDNSNRTRYQCVLTNPDLQIKRFYGCVPGSPFKSETAIISKIN